MKRFFRRWALLAGGTSVVALACSSFEAEDVAPDAEAGVDASGVEASTSNESGVDAGPGCPKGACGLVLASGETNASEIATDGKRIFWTIDQANGAVRTIDPTTNMPKTISGPEDRPRSPVVYNDIVYYATGRAVHFIGRDGDRDGGTRGTATGSTLDAGGATVTSVQRAGNQILFTAGKVLLRCTPTGDGCGGATVSAESFPGSGVNAPLTLAPNGTAWFADPVEILEVQTGPYDALTRFNQTDVRALAVDDTKVYFLRVNGKSIEYLPTGGDIDETAITLATADSPPYAIAVDATHVYFTVIESGSLMKVKKTGGPVSPVATELEAPKGLAIYNDRVLVVANGRILSLPKGD